MRRTIGNDRLYRVSFGLTGRETSKVRLNATTVREIVFTYVKNRKHLSRRTAGPVVHQLNHLLPQGKFQPSLRNGPEIPDKLPLI